MQGSGVVNAWRWEFQRKELKIKLGRSQFYLKFLIRIASPWGETEEVSSEN